MTQEIGLNQRVMEDRRELPENKDWDLEAARGQVKQAAVELDTQLRRAIAQQLYLLTEEQLIFWRDRSGPGKSICEEYEEAPRPPLTYRVGTWMQGYTWFLEVNGERDSNHYKLIVRMDHASLDVQRTITDQQDVFNKLEMSVRHLIATGKYKKLHTEYNHGGYTMTDKHRELCDLTREWLGF